jgi:YVTN family beta-propeller protein
VTELDASDGSMVQNVSVGITPEGIVSDGTHVWVANSNGNTVTELNASTGTVAQTIGVGDIPVAVSSDGSHLWVANSGSGTVSDITVAFDITTPNLPSVSPGTPYGPVTLQADNLGASASPYTTTLKWRKVALPKGLKLSSTGVLSGTPAKRIAPGQSSVTVQVTETVTTVNARNRPVKTKSTAEATMPLYIN